jgi:hypothetical protein
MSSTTISLEVIRNLINGVRRLQVTVDQFRAQRSINDFNRDACVQEPRVYSKDACILEVRDMSCREAYKLTRRSQKYVKEHAVHVLGLDSNILTSDWALPSSDLFLSTSDSSSEGNLRIDWEETGVTPWTRHIAVIFEGLFLQEHRLGSFPLLQDHIEPGAVAHTFLKVVQALKEVYNSIHSAKESHKRSNPDVSRRYRRSSRCRQVLSFACILRSPILY